MNINVEDKLTSTIATNALSANKGRELKGLVDTNATEISTNTSNITTNTSDIAGAVMTTGDQTVAGAKTFSTKIVGNISGNAATATALETGRTIAGNAFDGTDAGSGIIISATERSAIGTNAKNIGTNTTNNNGAVTAHSDESDAGSGIIISTAERTAIGTITKTTV